MGLKMAGRIGLLRRLSDEAGELLSLLSAGFHLLAGELALDVEGLFEILCVDKALSELEIRLEVSLRIFHGLLVDLFRAGRDHVGRFRNNLMSLAGGFEEAVVSFTGLLDALAGE